MCIRDRAYTDVLTGAASRRYGLLKLDRMVQERKQFSVALIDLDGLKTVSYTHLGADVHSVEFLKQQRINRSVQIFRQLVAAGA